MISAYAVADVRAAEARAMAALGPGADGELMQRAATGLAVAIATLLPHGVYGARVVLLVGSGANGGDALWAGARLARRGARVAAILVAERAHESGLAALTAAGGRSHRGDSAAGLAALFAAEVVVDGVLGIGGRAGVDERVGRLLSAVPDSAVVVAVDLPSGVDPETGETGAGAAGQVNQVSQVSQVSQVFADVTVTFGAVKPCLLLPPAAQAAGRVQLVDIGLGGSVDGLAGSAPAVQQWEPADVASAWPVPGPADDKYSRGVLGVVAGGANYTGAAVLCTGAAVRAGAGMVRYVGPRLPTDLVRARWPEVVPGPGRVQAWVLGPGVDADTHSDTDAGQRRAIESAFAEGVPCVVDAGALAWLPDRVEVPTLLTPHSGELARLLSERTGELVERRAVDARPLRHARLASELTGATVLLKGAVCVLVAPDGRVRTAQDGPHWLATAGSGDVLAGIAGALLAAGLDPLDAASMAVTVHGLAAQRANPDGPVHAESVLHAVPATIAALLG